MSKSPLIQRPKHLLAIYVEPSRVEIVWAHRNWRTWRAGLPEVFAVADGEAPYDLIERLNIRPKGKNTALVLFLSRSYYIFHREYYPIAIEDQLEETLAFDWPDNVFYENGQTLHFHGAPVGAGDFLSVPVFALRQDIYDKFEQALNAALFRNFAVVPSALAYKRFMEKLDMGNETGDFVPVEIMGRQIDPVHLEINRFRGGKLQDSLLIRNDQDTPKLFWENARCLDDRSGEEVRIRLLCSVSESGAQYCDVWKSRQLPLTLDERENSLLSYWVEDLWAQERVQGFGAPVQLKPWSVPVAAWIMIVFVVLYAFFVGFKAHERSVLTKSLQDLESRRAKLEAQWKPIEKLQNRIPQLQEGQKALAQFGQENYPVVGVLTVLSLHTPDDTWLNYFSTKGKEVTLRGESKSAIKYLSDLNKVQGFEDVRFGSPVSKNPASDKERFHIQMMVNLEKLKKSLENPATVEGGGDASGNPTAAAPDVSLSLNAK